MRKLILGGLLLVGLFLACDTKTPTGPSTVTVSSPATSTTTTSVPGTVPPTTSTSTSTSTIPTIATIRTYVAFGQVPPNVPSQLTIVLQPLSGGSALSYLLARIPFFEKQADPPVWAVLGFYRTGGGGSGQVKGQLVGTLNDGSFNGTLTADSPECVAEREFAGTVDPQFLRWTGGRTLRDCKGSPLGFSSLLMLATDAPPPTTTAISSSTTTMPLQCSYALSASSVSVEASGGQRTVGVTTAPNCGWTVQNFVDWITVQPTAGSGAGTVVLSVSANQGPPRSATVVIAGIAFVVNQGVPTTTTTTSTSTTSTTTTSVLPLPDLLPVTPTGSFCRRDPSDLTILWVDVKNVGNATAAGSFTRVFFDAGPGGSSSTDRLTPMLAPDATASNLAFTIPASCRIINCSMLIAADVLSSVVESNEVNNSVTATCDFRILLGDGARGRSIR